MALLSVIRRWHFRKGMSFREISRRTGLSRNTVKKYLKAGIVEPVPLKRERVNLLDDYEQTLITWLHRESKQTRKQRQTLKQLYQSLILLGYTGSYDRVAAFARRWRQQQQRATVSGRAVFVPLSFARGEAFQFDWSEDWATIAGRRSKLQIAHFKLCHSRVFYLRAYRSQSHEMLFDAHYRAFEAFGGVPERGIYDNMKTAVDRVGKGKERHINQRFQAMASHYLFEPEFCNRAAGWEKGQVEKCVLDRRHQIWQEAPRFMSLAELNVWLEARCQQLWGNMIHPEQRPLTLVQCWQDEQPGLMPVPPAFDSFVEHIKRVSSTCLVTFERNRYSVPAQWANRRIQLRVYAQYLVMVAQGKQIAKHERVFLVQDNRTPAKTVYDWRHYLSVLERKPGALRNGAPFSQLPECFTKLQKKLLRRPGGDREMVDILALVLWHDQSLVERAVSEVLILESPSKQQVLNHLHRLTDDQQIQALQPLCLPDGLAVVTEPQANTRQYDELRGRGYAK